VLLLEFELEVLELDSVLVLVAAPVALLLDEFTEDLTWFDG